MTSGSRRYLSVVNEMRLRVPDRAPRGEASGAATSSARTPRAVAVTA